MLYVKATAVEQFCCLTGHRWERLEVGLAAIHCPVWFRQRWMCSPDETCLRNPGVEV
jgi:hypothetical protein